MGGSATVESTFVYYYYSGRWCVYRLLCVCGLTGAVTNERTANAGFADENVVSSVEQYRCVCDSLRLLSVFA